DDASAAIQNAASLDSQRYNLLIIMPTVQVFNQNAREYQEQNDGFLVLATRFRGESITNLGCWPTQQEAEEFARKRVKEGQVEKAFVVPAKLACGIERH